MSLRILHIFLIALFACTAGYAEFNWTWTTTCPESGTNSPVAAFTATTSVGFSGSGTCSRISTGFTQFDWVTKNTSTNYNTTFFGLNTSDMLMIPPMVTWETKPIVSISSACPSQDKTLNFIVFHWKQNYRNVLNGIVVMGRNTFDTSTGIDVQMAYDVTGTTILTGPVALGGSCSSGVHTLSGSGDRAGSVYFTQSGFGFYSTVTEKRYFFVPQRAISAAADLGSRTLPGYQFNSTSASSAKPIKVITDAAGTTWTIQAYTDASAGTLDATYTDTITISSVNSPENGMMYGTLTRVGTGAGSGDIACIVGKGVATRVFCAGEQPDDNTIPYSITFVEDGGHLIGQDSGISVAGDAGINTSEGIYTDGTRLFVADTNNHRVLIWNTIPTSNQVTPNVVLGQPDLYSAAANNGGRTGQSMSSPRSVYSNGTKLFVADSGNHRILVWNAIPTVTQTSADFVLGQTNTTAGGANAGGRNYNTVSGPYSVSGDGTRLFVADNGNNRVLIWNALPTAFKQSADVVIGQPGPTVATANNGGISAATMSAPRSVHSDGTKLVVADLSNHRVLIWNAIPTTNSVAADVILGQPDATSATANNGGRSGQTFNNPRGVYIHSSKLYVADQSNNRVLIWNAIPTVTQTTADLVLGQTNMTGATANLGGRSATSLSGPRGVAATGTNLFVLDTANFRALMWNAIPTVNAATANVVQGQPTMGTGTANNLGLGDDILNSPQEAFTDGTRVFVVDNTYNRVLIWNSIPSYNKRPADVVLGQPDMDTGDVNNGGRSASSLSGPQGVYSDGTKLYVADAGNHRVLVWNTMPTVNQAAADFVLGQPDFASGTANNGGRSGKTMNAPQSVVSDGTNLYVADASNNRVLVWTTLPTATQVSADFALGQTNSTGATANLGGRSASSLSTPRGVATNGTAVAVADQANNRVLVWSTPPVGYAEAADYVIGQPDAASATANNGGIGANTLSGPYGVDIKNNQMIVSDSGNNRMLVWHSIPTSNQQSANAVLGQSNFTSATANNGGLSAKRLSTPRRSNSDGTRLYVADSANNRIVVFEVP